MPRTLSVLIPVYNEERALSALLDAVDARPEVTELIIVDDASTDRSRVQDADLEYDPADYPALLAPLTLRDGVAALAVL